MEKKLTPESISLLYEETKRRLDELTILYEMTKISHSALSFDQMLDEITKTLKDFFNFERLAVLLIDDTTGRLSLHPSSIGFSNNEIEALHLRVGQGITGWMTENGKSLLIKDIFRDSRFGGSRKEILSEMSVPLLAGEKVIGALDVQSFRKNAFSEKMLRLFEKVGEHLAQIIENARSEERYRTVVESALDGVLVMGEDYRLTYVNERLAELLGYDRSGLIGAEFLDFLDEKGQILLKERDHLRKKGQDLPSHYEVNILRKNGEVRTVEINATEMRDGHGNSTQIAFLKDITEKRKMEEQLFQAEKLRSLGEMASGVAHDFNNALAIILGNTQLLLFSVKDKEQIQALKVIEKVAKDSAQTVRRLQEFTKSQVKQDLYRMDINAIVKDAVEITRPKWKDEAQGRGAHIEMVTHLEEVPYGAGNVSELREVITNMIFNAVEALPEGGRIEIKTYHKEEKVFIEVSDSGIGMSEEVQKRVFEPFFTTKPFTNTGLGLSMAYGIIKRFGGEIEVKSEPGKGSTFLISLKTKAEMKLLDESAQGLRPQKKAKILVIDDEPQVREVLSRGLSAFQHQVTEALSGEQGIKLIEEKDFDLVLTDLGMPNLSGWDVCKAIKKIRPETPVGMITGWGMVIDERKKKESGVDFIISKPFDITHILNLIAESVGHREKTVYDQA